MTRDGKFLQWRSGYHLIWWALTVRLWCKHKRYSFLRMLPSGRALFHCHDCDDDVRGPLALWDER